MLQVHHNGVGECGVFTYEIAETKVVAGDGPRAQEPAPPSMHHGKEVKGARCRFSPARSKRPSVGRSSLANERRHEYATLEHLLLALIDDVDAAAVLRACGVDLDGLRKTVVHYLDTELENLVVDSQEEAKATAGFQRVVQRAAFHVQSSGREEVTGANVLVAIFAERETHAAYFLQEQDMTRYDAVNYISHGIAKRPGHVGSLAPAARRRRRA